MNSRPDSLLSPQKALGDYLDEMLHRATTAVSNETVAEAETIAEPAAVVGPEVVAEAETVVEAESIAAQRSTTEAAPALPAAEEGHAAIEIEFPVQCLMFRVGEHLLSVPLIQLAGVVNWSDAITRLPESPSWMLGLVQHREQNLRIVDSHELLAIDARGDCIPEHLLVLGGSDWAITCDHLEQVVQLQADDIQWRGDGASPYTLGTIRDSLSTLLNPPGIAASLDAQIND